MERGATTYARIEGAVEVDPVSCRAVSVRELHSTHFPDEDGSLINQSLDCGSGRVARLVERVVGAVSAACPKTLDVIDIFHS